MGTRGRKSSAELSVASTSSIERPEPPAHLSEEEKTEWQAIVSHMPPNWVTRERYAHLEAYCTHAVARRFAAKQYELEMASEEPDAGKCKKWSDIHNTESKNIQSLGIRLDIAQSTSYERMKRNGSKPAPWK